jgi:uncharacterized protein YuzB (UPF0349 family)
MATTIEYCLRNVDAGMRERLATIDADVRARRCCQRCGDCYRGDFLVVDGVLETGAHETLLAAHEES